MVIWMFSYFLLNLSSLLFPLFYLRMVDESMSTIFSWRINQDSKTFYFGFIFVLSNILKPHRYFIFVYWTNSFEKDSNSRFSLKRYLRNLILFRHYIPSLGNCKDITQIQIKVSHQKFTMRNICLLLCGFMSTHFRQGNFWFPTFLFRHLVQQSQEISKKFDLKRRHMYFLFNIL